MFAGRTTTEVIARNQNAGTRKTFVIERVRLLRAVFSEAHVVEHVFAETVEGHALHESRRDDAIGINVVSGDGNRPAVDLGNRS